MKVKGPNITNLTRHLRRLNRWSSLSKDSNEYQLVSIPSLCIILLPLTNVLARIGSSQGNYLCAEQGGFQILQNLLSQKCLLHRVGITLEETNYDYDFDSDYYYCFDFIIIIIILIIIFIAISISISIRNGIVVALKPQYGHVIHETIPLSRSNEAFNI